MSKTNRRVCVCLLLVLLIAAIIIGIVLGIVLTKGKDGGGGDGEGEKTTNTPEMLIRIHGHWSPWDPWSTCSATCGGGSQTRSRQCSDPSPRNGGRDCEGDSTQTRICAEWSCPDCSKTCGQGVLNTQCSYCSCPGTVISGQIVEEYKLENDKNIMRVPDAEVFVTGHEWEPVATSDHMGNFEVKDICEATFKIKKDGYLTQELTLSGNHKIAMERKEKPQFVYHPKSQGVFEGQSVTLTCIALSKPIVDKYEWYKNGVRLTGLDGSGLLKLSPVSPDRAGDYKCRAVSEAGNAFSNEGTLTVVDDSKSDTCEAVPREHIVKLPASCHSTVNGMKTTTIDVGKCQDMQCTSKSDASSACCGSIQTEPVLVSCEGFEYNLYKTSACGCSLCTDAGKDIGVIITANVKDQLGNTLQGSQYTFIYNGTVVTEYSGSSYYLKVDKSVKEIALTFISGRYNEYMPTVKIFKIFQDRNNEFKIDLLPKGKAQVIETNTNTTLDVGTKTKLTIPANAFTTENGEVYDGEANVYTSFFDPASLETFQDAPGMFTFVDEEGYEQQLQTFGVLGVHAETPNGNSLSINGDVKVEIDPQQMKIQTTEEGEIDAFLWTLDPDTGRWIMAGPLTPSSSSLTHRTKRQSSSQAGGSVAIPYPLPYLNLDKPIYQSGLCEVAIYTYVDNTFQSVLGNRGVTVYTKSLDGSTYLGLLTTYSDSNGKLCLPVPCGYQHEIWGSDVFSDPLMSTSHKLPAGYQFRNYDGKKVAITSPATGAITNGLGPIHLKSAETCGASTVNDYHFQIAYPYVPNGELYAKELQPNKKLSWYPRSTSKKACFASIRILGDFENIEVSAVSKFQSKDGEEYGVYLTSPKQFVEQELKQEIPGEKVACVQVKCPEANITDTETGMVYRNISTYVDIQINHPKKQECELSHTADENDRYSHLTLHGTTEHSIDVTFHPLLDGYSYYMTYSNEAPEEAARSCRLGTLQDLAIFKCGNFEESSIPWWRPGQGVK